MVWPPHHGAAASSQAKKAAPEREGFFDKTPPYLLASSKVFFNDPEPLRPVWDKAPSIAPGAWPPLPSHSELILGWDGLPTQTDGSNATTLLIGHLFWPPAVYDPWPQRGATLTMVVVRSRPDGAVNWRSEEVILPFNREKHEARFNADQAYYFIAEQNTEYQAEAIYNCFDYTVFARRFITTNIAPKAYRLAASKAITNVFTNTAISKPSSRYQTSILVVKLAYEDRVAQFETGYTLIDRKLYFSWADPIPASISTRAGLNLDARTGITRGAYLTSRT